MASKWNLLVIYIIENNEYALGTSIERVSKETDLHKRGEAFGMPCYKIDGMKIEELYKHLSQISQEVRTGSGRAMSWRRRDVDRCLDSVRCI